MSRKGAFLLEFAQRLQPFGVSNAQKSTFAETGQNDAPQLTAEEIMRPKALLEQNNEKK